VTIDGAVTRVLARLSDGQVRSLAAACAGASTPPARLAGAVVGAKPGAHDAVSELAAAWRAQAALTGDGVALALRTGLTARTEAAARRCRPVWTGPGTAGDQRLTGAVLHDLVAGARERVLVVSYAAYTLGGLAADLEAAVARGCTVDVVFETEEDSAGAYAGPHAQPFGAIAGLRRWRWPPEARGQPGAVMHAKALVVDGTRALVGSANLTHRALTANIEAGVLIEDPDVAGSIEAHVVALMRAGTITPAV
jgi:phosphatidylserine/phosphatidylglycerophosphate/cardiolipin synthase-like enzyme